MGYFMRWCESAEGLELAGCQLGVEADEGDRVIAVLSSSEAAQIEADLDGFNLGTVAAAGPLQPLFCNLPDPLPLLFGKRGQGEWSGGPGQIARLLLHQLHQSVDAEMAGGREIFVQLQALEELVHVEMLDLIRRPVVHQLDE